MEVEIPDFTNEIKYTEDQEVFVGRYSHVYKGTLRGEMVAIKMIQPVKNSLHSMRRKFRRESQVWARLRHENIVALYGYAEDTKMFGLFGALISPWCQNGDADKYLKDKGSMLTFEERKCLWQGVVAGVHYLHSQDPPIIHGDLKPGNVLIDAQGVAKICDFGLARILTAEDDPSGMTTTSVHTGTERYLPYELVVSEDPGQLTTRSDVYSMGCVGLVFIFLQIPYATRENNKFGDISRDIRDGIPPAVQSDSLSTEASHVWSVLERCWGIVPDMRASTVCILKALQQMTPLNSQHNIEFPSPLLPASLPRELSLEGDRWYAMYNPHRLKTLMIDLVHEIQSSSCACIRFVKNGKYLATFDSGEVQIYDVEIFVSVSQFKLTEDRDIVSFSPSGEYIAAGGQDGQIRLWDITKREICHLLQGHLTVISSICFSFTGLLIASGDRSGAIMLWNVDTGDCVLKTMSESTVRCVNISPDDTLLFAGTDKGIIWIYHISTVTILGNIQSNSNSITSLVSTPDGRGFISGSGDKTIKYWEIDFEDIRAKIDKRQSSGIKEGWKSPARCLQSLTGHTDDVRHVSISPDGQWIVSGSHDCTIMFWDKDGHSQLVLNGYHFFINSIDFSPIGGLFATSAWGSPIKIWKYSTA